MFSVSDFSLCDQVAWNANLFPTMVGQMIDKYGDGPFKVVGLRLHGTGVSDMHPVAVTIELLNGQRQEFAGEWFKKTP